VRVAELLKTVAELD
jgi:hypothetical protein